MAEIIIVVVVVVCNCFEFTYVHTLGREQNSSLRAQKPVSGDVIPQPLLFLIIIADFFQQHSTENAINSHYVVEWSGVHYYNYSTSSAAASCRSLGLWE